jgi:hypothetical protein
MLAAPTTSTSDPFDDFAPLSDADKLASEAAHQANLSHTPTLSDEENAALDAAMADPELDRLNLSL